MVKKTKRVVKRKVSPKKLRKGFSNLKILFIVIGILILAGTGFFLLSKSKTLQAVNPFVEKIAITKPSPDMARARRLTIDPAKDTVMQVTTREKVKISLIVPKGAIAKKQTVDLIPYYYNKKTNDPSAGVIISPASVTFNHPVTLLFDLSESQFRTDAPKNQKDKTIRYSGTSQVLTLDKDATELIPVLVARELETSTQLRARVLGGGGYVFTTQKDKQIVWAKHAFSKEKINSISILEATNALLSNKEKLSKEMRAKAEGAAAKILSKKNPPVSEIYAALVAQKLLNESKVSFIGTVYALESNEGFFITACKLDDLSVEQYIGYARTAQLMGYGAIGENCMVKAKNLVAQSAERVLNDKGASLKDTITALQDVQFMGIDEESMLDEALMGQARKIAEEEAKKVAEDPNSTDREAALELQKLQAFGIEGSTAQKLEKRLLDRIEGSEGNGNGETPPAPPEEPKTSPEDYGEGTTIDEEEILGEQVWAAFGLAMMKAAKFDGLDEESMKKRADENEMYAREMNEAVYIACLEMGGDDCDSKHAELSSQIDKALDESYTIAEKIGTVQSQDYDEPEYDDMQMYIEMTPEPEQEGDSGNYEVGGEESDQQSEIMYDENTSDPADSYEDTHSAPEEYTPAEDSYQEESSSEVESEDVN